MRRHRSVLLATAFSLCVVGLAGAWRTDVAGTPSPSRPSDVTTLPDGTVVSAGRIRVDDTQDDALVVALDGPTGAERWRHVYGGTDTTANDLFRRVVRGTDDTVVAAGRIFDLATGTDALVVRLAGADGAVVWESLRDGGEGLTDDTQDVAVLGGGDVVAVGRLESGIDLGSFAVWRLAAATGETLWTSHLDVPGGIGRRIAVSGDAAYVVGETDATGSNDDVVVARVSLADGNVLWTTTIEGDAGADDDATGIVASGDQVTVLATVVQTATGPDALVAALAADGGAERWRARFDGSATAGDDADSAAALVLAPNGDAVVTGTVSNLVTGNDVVVARLAAGDGGVLWRTERDGGNEANDDARGLAYGTQGTADGAFVTGRLREPGVRGEIAALRIHAATGTVVWQRAIEGGSDLNDIGIAIAIDPNGDVAIAGRARRDDTGDEFAVLKLTASSGGSFPCANGIVDPGEECDDGNIAPGDGCRRDCTVEVCGDGILDPGEACDDPSNVCCAPDCQLATAETLCDDGDACTTTDVCIAGECVGGAPVVCPAPGQCETIACDSLTGLCVETPRPDATSCTDGNACTRSDQCRTGVCMSGVAEVCDDFEPCTIDGCDPTSGCTFTPLAGIPSVACAVDQPRITQQCGASVPRSIERRIAKITRMLDKAEASTSPRRIRRLLRKTTKNARRAGKKSARLRDRQRIPFVCGETLVRVMADIEARADLQRTLPPPSGT